MHNIKYIISDKEMKAVSVLLEDKVFVMTILSNSDTNYSPVLTTYNYDGTVELHLCKPHGTGCV